MRQHGQQVKRSARPTTLHHHHSVPPAPEVKALITSGNASALLTFKWLKSHKDYQHFY